MDHLLAKGIDKGLQFLHRRRMKRWVGESAPFVVEGNVRRFAALASMVAGRDVEVAELRGDVSPKHYWPILYKTAHPSMLPEHGFGWSDGETLFLPVSIVEMPTERAAERLARLLVFFLSYQVRCGTLDAARRRAHELTADRALADIFWIVENIRLLGEISGDYEGVARSWPETARYLISRRPGAKALTRGEERVEEFLERSVEATIRNGGGALPEGWPATADESFSYARRVREGFSGEVSFRRYRSIVPFFAWGKLVVDRIKDPSAAALAGPGGKDRPGGRSEEGGENEEAGEKPDKRVRYAATREDVDEEANEQGLTLNIYDKFLSWTEFVNVQRPFDDDPDKDLKKKADEMEELATADVGKSTSATFDAELEKTDRYTEDDAVAPDDGAGEVHVYPEWDYKKRVYREDYSMLTETAAEEEQGGGFAARVLGEKRGLIKEVTRSFEMLTPESRLLGRQLDGELIDLNATVEAIADIEAGHTPDERLYATRTDNERDLSAIFLVDLSMSTDAWVGDTKIIDHEKEALIILCEAMKKLRDRYAIYGFSGKTRKGCRFFRVKGFDENDGAKVRDRIGGLIPYSYTRMGPAVRHATELLKKESTRARLLFFISDGKPNDVDVYEGRYGIEDTRMAIKEAERDGIVPFCLTVDTGASDYLPRLFGHGNYAVVPGVDKLAKKLPELYARIVHTI